MNYTIRQMTDTEAIIIRYGEIALKGKNRINFENKLLDNIERIAKARPKRTSGRFILYIDAKDMQKTAEKLKKVFGITSLSIAKEVDLDMDKIGSEALERAKGRRFRTFRITAQRTQKRLKPSPDIEREIGAYIVEKTGKKVKLKDPDLEIFIEISEHAYVFTEKMQCHGGLPVGIEGNVALIIEEKNKKELDKSILAGLLMMKRGCNIYPFRYSSMKASMKKSANDKKSLKLLEDYGAKTIVIAKDINEIQTKALKMQCRALAIGNTIGNLSGPHKEIETDMVILTPLISYNEKEISEKLKGFR